MTDYKLDYKHYRVSIQKIDGAAPSDGFVDDKDPLDWGSTDKGFPTTLASSLAKTRASLRWREIIQRLQENATPKIFRIDANGATPDTPATTFDFTLMYEREAYVYAYNPDATGEDDKIIYGMDAIKIQIAKALMMNRDINTTIYDPKNDKHYNDQIAIISVGKLVDSIADGKAKITVQEIPNT